MSDYQHQITFRQYIIGVFRFIWQMLPVILKYRDKIIYNNTPRADSIGRYLEEHTRQRPDHPAILFDNQTLTYREFNDEINCLADYLLSLGFSKGDVFVVLMDNRPEMLICLGAAAKIGAIASLINSNLRGSALHHCIAVSSSKAVIIGEELLDAFEEIKTDLQMDPAFPLLLMAEKGRISIPDRYRDLKQLMTVSSRENPVTTAGVTTHDAFAYVFTSGTTGMPKAAYQYHRSWIMAGHYLGKGVLRMKPEDRFYVCLPFYHTNPVKMAWSIIHSNGATLVMARKFSTSRFWDDVRKYKVTVFNYIGELCTYLVNQAERDDDRNHSVRAMIGNGMRSSIFGTFRKRFGIKQIIEMYGASEYDLVFTNLFNLDGTIGTSFSKFALAKFDVEKNELVQNENGFLSKVKKGEPGILLGKVNDSVNITGYARNEDTEKKLIRDAFEKGDCWFDTGDVLRNIGWRHHEFVDRTGDTFRWKGENVATLEVENIVNAFPGVEQCTVYGVKLGQGDGRIGMVAVLPESKPKTFDFKGFGQLLLDSLPAYAVPRFLRLKTVFETTTTFKIKKLTLQEEGFDLKKIRDPLFVLLPGDKTYTPLDQEIYSRIMEGQYRF
ncbi:long-chain-acyl-CoA synthetase [bacterium]|nr:long-chain-acyl-CoA synthetase [bacterium]